MATFTASAAQSFAPAVYRENGVVARVITYTAGAAASVGDIIQMCKIPNGAVVNTVIVAVSQSAGATTVNIGDGNDTSAFGASVVLSGAAAFASAMTYRGLGRSYSAEDTIDLQVAVISAAPTSATYKLYIAYSNQNDPQG